MPQRIAEVVVFFGRRLTQTPYNLGPLLAVLCHSECSEESLINSIPSRMQSPTCIQRSFAFAQDDKDKPPKSNRVF